MAFFPSIADKNKYLSRFSIGSPRQRIYNFGKKGVYINLASVAILFVGDRLRQFKNRVVFNQYKPKGKTRYESYTMLTVNDLDTWNYSPDNNLSKKYGDDAKVFIGSACKLGFRDLLPHTIDEHVKDQHTAPIDTSKVCHMAIAVKPVTHPEEKMLIIGRQSNQGPWQTLYKAMLEGKKQYIQPDKDQTIVSCVRRGLHTHIQNEVTHMAKGATFDTHLITDLAIPTQYVDQAFLLAEKNLDPVMTFVWNNCITTEVYVLLKIADMVDRWADSKRKDAPSRKEADAFIIGCYETINKSIRARGYGVLNNAKIMTMFKEQSTMTKRIDDTASFYQVPTQLSHKL